MPFVPGRVGQEDSAAGEVTRVVELVADHARTRPGMSLGVIAMGIKHANRIQEALRRARLTDEDLDAFLDGTASEQARKEVFFVKNLERVQGDERDAIILTIGYGKSVDERMLYRFGPVDNEGGERRLNVAVTRARPDDCRLVILGGGHGPSQAAIRGRQDAVPLPEPGRHDRCCRVRLATSTSPRARCA